MTSLFLAALFFIAIHLGISGTRARDLIVGRLGLKAYMVVFSLGSIAGIVWLISAYKAAGYVPLWGQLEWWKPVAIVLMLPAFVLVVAGLATPNPTSVAQDGLAANPPRGLVRVTRHPFLVGVSIWAAVHLIGNGDMASVLLFGSLLIVAALGTLSIDAKRRRASAPGVWDGFAARTSIVPFAAILGGRADRATSWLREMGWARPAAGIAAYALMLGGHAHLIGVSPFPA